MENNMKILVTGARGQLGHDVCRELIRRGYTCVRGIDIDELDITCEEAVRKFMGDFRPDTVVHCAAYTAVDRAETESELCRRVNAFGTKHLSKAAGDLGAKFLYVSTDYVFDGQKEGEYLPDDLRCPCSVYGATKAEGEDFVRSACKKHFIVRTAWVFGKAGNHFVKTMLRLTETKKELSVVCDQVGSPTYTVELAKLLADMCESEKYGVYHATCEGFCSWYEFALEIFRLAGKNVTVHPVTTEQYRTMVTQQALRPLNSRLNKDKLVEHGFSRLSSWQDALKSYLSELNEQ